MANYRCVGLVLAAAALAIGCGNLESPAAPTTVVSEVLDTGGTEALETSGPSVLATVDARRQCRLSVTPRRDGSVVVQACGTPRWRLCAWGLRNGRKSPKKILANRVGTLVSWVDQTIGTSVDVDTSALADADRTAQFELDLSPGACLASQAPLASYTFDID